MKDGIEVVLWDCIERDLALIYIGNERNGRLAGPSSSLRDVLYEREQKRWT